MDSKRQNRMMLSKTPPTRRPTQQSTNQLTPRYQKQVVGKEHTLGLGGWGWGKGAALGWMGMGLWAALWMPPALCGMDGPGEPPVQRGEMSASGSLDSVEEGGLQPPGPHGAYPCGTITELSVTAPGGGEGRGVFGGWGGRGVCARACTHAGGRGCPGAWPALR